MFVMEMIEKVLAHLCIHGGLLRVAVCLSERTLVKITRSGQNRQVDRLDKMDKWTERTSGQNGQVDRTDKWTKRTSGQVGQNRQVDRLEKWTKWTSGQNGQVDRMGKKTCGQSEQVDYRTEG